MEFYILISLRIPLCKSEKLKMNPFKVRGFQEPNLVGYLLLLQIICVALQTETCWDLFCEFRLFLIGSDPPLFFLALKSLKVSFHIRFCCIKNISTTVDLQGFDADADPDPTSYFEADLVPNQMYIHIALQQCLLSFANEIYSTVRNYQLNGQL